MMLSPTAVLRVASRGRSMSTAAAAPKIHKYKDAAPELMKTRPPPGHDHVSYDGDVDLFYPIIYE